MAVDSEIVRLAEEVTAIAKTIHVRTAVVEAYALAAHGFIRATEDFDLGADLMPEGLRRLEAALRGAGLVTELREPDEDDDLGGVLDVRRNPQDLEYVQVINFRNVHRLRRLHPGIAAVERAEPIPGSNLLAAPLADLIAMKLHAWKQLGDTAARNDIVELLRRNRGAAHDKLSAVAADYGLDGALQELIAEV